MTTAIEPISANLVIDHATARPSELQSLSENFNQMMAHEPNPQQFSEVQHNSSDTPMTHFVGAQEQVMRQTFDDVRNFTLQAPNLDWQTMAARQIELNYQISMVQVQFNAGVYVAQSSKSGMQTLMKNQ